MNLGTITPIVSNPPHRDAALAIYDAAHHATRTRLVPRRLPDAAPDVGLNAANPRIPLRLLSNLQVELGGLEPPTSWVRSRRSPN
jgi:hypothetical protein